MTTTVELIRALRASGMRQAEIARRAEIPQSRLSRWEAGAVPAGADDALRLKRLHDETFGIDSADPIAAEEAPEAPPPDERKADHDDAAAPHSEAVDERRLGGERRQSGVGDVA